MKPASVVLQCSIVKYRPLGELEQAVLLAVVRLGDGAYGRAIRDELEACTGRRVAHGPAYVTLDRLQAKGLVRSRLADAADERGGRRRRYFQVTPAGVKSLRESRAALMRLWDGVKQVRGDS
jgi:PadR family transcriptional regulator PadR